jgi:hypothetical protein
MELLEDVAEAAVVAAFLRAELNSPRYRSTVLLLLDKAGAPARILENPDLADAGENDLRGRILGAYRGWPDRLLFLRFPRAARWRRAVLAQADLSRVMYVNDDPRLPGRETWDKVCWFDLAGGTRFVKDGAANVNRGRPAPGYEPVFRNIVATADALRRGAEVPELILARQSVTSPLLIIEGHTRATAYVLSARERIPVFIGEAPGLDRWHMS